MLMSINLIDIRVKAGGSFHSIKFHFWPLEYLLAFGRCSHLTCSTTFTSPCAAEDSGASAAADPAVPNAPVSGRLRR